MSNVIISGPGRAGTSFLVRLLTRLGLDTGFEINSDKYNPKVRAGLEHQVSRVIATVPSIEDCKEILKKPKIQKSCDFAFVLKHILEHKIMRIERVIVPIRNIKEVTESRVKNKLLWRAPNVDQQYVVCYLSLGMLIEACTLYDVPIHFLKYPSYLKSNVHLYEFLKMVFPVEFKKITRNKFCRVKNKLEKEMFP